MRACVRVRARVRARSFHFPFHFSSRIKQAFPSVRRSCSIANMFVRANLCFTFAIFASYVGASVVTESRGDDVGVQYTLNLHPPTEDPVSVQSSLDVIMSAENAKRRRADEEYAMEKQAMLDAEKRKIQDIIQSAFARYGSSF